MCYHRLCRLHGSHPKTWARSYRIGNIGCLERSRSWSGNRSYRLYTSSVRDGAPSSPEALLRHFSIIRSVLYNSIGFPLRAVSLLLSGRRWENQGSPKQKREPMHMYCVCVRWLRGWASVFECSDNTDHQFPLQLMVYSYIPTTVDGLFIHLPARADISLMCMICMICMI